MSDIESRVIILSRQWIRRLICAFVVRIWHKQVFSWRGSFCPIHAKQKSTNYDTWVMSWENLSPEFGNKVRLKLVCSATEASKIKISDIATTVIIIILSRERITKALIRLCGCAGWSATVVCIWHKQVFPWRGSFANSQGSGEPAHLQFC